MKKRLGILLLTLAMTGCGVRLPDESYTGEWTPRANDEIFHCERPWRIYGQVFHGWCVIYNGDSMKAYPSNDPNSCYEEGTELNEECPE